MKSQKTIIKRQQLKKSQLKIFFSETKKST